MSKKSRFTFDEYMYIYSIHACICLTVCIHKILTVCVSLGLARAIYLFTNFGSCVDPGIIFVCSRFSFSHFEKVFIQNWPSVTELFGRLAIYFFNLSKHRIDT